MKMSLRFFQREKKYLTHFQLRDFRDLYSVSELSKYFCMEKIFFTDSNHIIQSRGNDKRLNKASTPKQPFSQIFNPKNQKKTRRKKQFVKLTPLLKHSSTIPNEETSPQNSQDIAKQKINKKRVKFDKKTLNKKINGIKQKKSIIMKQEVMNYEIDIFHKEAVSSPHLPKHDPCAHRYTEWELVETLSQVVRKGRKYQVRWIGNAINSHILAFFYCVLVGSLNHHDDTTFTKVKHALYGVCREWLTVAEQKTLVEHLSLVQYTKSITEFLKKSNHLENILVKIFSTFKRELRDKHHKLPYPSKLLKLQELQHYAILFSFLQYKLINQKASQLIINQRQYLIVEEKDCIFVVEYEEPQQNKTEGKKKRKVAMTEIAEEDEGQTSRKLVFPSRMINSAGYVPPSPFNLSERERKCNPHESKIEKYSRSERISLSKQKPEPIHTQPFKIQTPQESMRSSFQPFERTSIRIEKDVQNTYNFLNTPIIEPIVRVVDPQKMKPSPQKIPITPKQEKNHRSLQNKEKKMQKKSSPKIPHFLKQKKQTCPPSIQISPRQMRDSKEKQTSSKKRQQLENESSWQFFPKPYQKKNIYKYDQKHDVKLQQRQYPIKTEYKESVSTPLTNISSERLLNFKVTHQHKFK